MHVHTIKWDTAMTPIERAIDTCNHVLRRASNYPNRDELLPCATLAIGQALEKWDGVRDLAVFTRVILQRRIQDYWRVHDRLTRTRRRELKDNGGYRRRIRCGCGRYVLIMAKCPHCGRSSREPTDREILAWEYVAHGMGYRAIAAKLGVSRQTVEADLTRLKRRLRATAEERINNSVLGRMWAERRVQAEEEDQQRKIQCGPVAPAKPEAKQ